MKLLDHMSVKKILARIKLWILTLCSQIIIIFPSRLNAISTVESYYANQAIAELDDDDEQDIQDPLERKRTAHSIAEQKRRDAIKVS